MGDKDANRYTSNAHESPPCRSSPWPRGRGGILERARELPQRPVAIKLRSASGIGTEGQARLLREARSAAGFNHSNIVTVYDAGEVDLDPGKGSRPLTVMELVAGANLADKPPQTIDQMVDFSHTRSVSIRLRTKGNPWRETRAATMG